MDLIQKGHFIGSPAMIRNVIGYEGKYVVDDSGNVFSVRANKYLVPVKMESGYLYAHLCDGKNGTKLKRIHRIVAEAFIENPCGYVQINHKNGNKEDNRVENLEWCSRKQNMQHAIKHGLFKTSGADNPSAKLSWEQVNIIREEYVYKDKQYGAKALAKKYGVTDVMIGKIVHGECWKEGFDVEHSLHRKVGDL